MVQEERWLSRAVEFTAIHDGDPLVMMLCQSVQEHEPIEVYD